MNPRPRGVSLPLAGLVGLLWLGGAALTFHAGWFGIGGSGGGATQPASAVPRVPVEEPVRLLTLGDPATSGLDRWPGVFDAPPVAFDFDGDGSHELVAHSNDTQLYVFSTATGRALAVLPTTYPEAWSIDRIITGPEVGVLRPGEPASIVATNHAAYVAAWRFVPGQSDADGFTFQRTWERRMDACHAAPSMDAKATLADLDGDGTLEVLVQTEEVGFYALHADGSTRWGHCWTGGNSAPAAGDLDGDGRLEAVFASDAGLLSVLDGATGDPQWTFHAADPRYGVWPASVSVSPTLADLDGVPPREVLFTARQAPYDEPADFPGFHMAIFAVRQSTTTWQGELVWVRQPAWANPLSYTQLVVRDVDGDRTPDILGMDWNTVGHKPGNWERLGPAHVFRLTPRGEDVWVRDIDAWWSNKDLVLTGGEGGPGLLAGGGYDAADGLWRLSPDTGEPLAFLTVMPWKVMRGPLLIDGANDGAQHLVLPVAPDEPSPSHGALLILELAPPATTPGRDTP